MDELKAVLKRKLNAETVDRFSAVELTELIRHGFDSEETLACATFDDLVERAKLREGYARVLLAAFQPGKPVMSSVFMLP